MPVASRRMAGFKAGRDRLLRWFANTVTALAAALAILMVAMVAVVLGIT
jgi:hypothetical protein